MGTVSFHAGRGKEPVKKKGKDEKGEDSSLRGSESDLRGRKKKEKAV